MQQYSFQLNMGRIGVALSVSRLDPGGIPEQIWYCLLNSRGIRVSRCSFDGREVTLCDFDTFLYPEAVEGGELQLVDLLSGSPVSEDHDIIRLCSFLVAKWVAGHTEESFYETIRNTLSLWTNNNEGKNK